MGNTHGGKSSLQNLIETLTARSLRGDSRNPDDVTFKGMSIYLNEQAGNHSGWHPAHSIERIGRYQDVVNLAAKIGMSEEATLRLLTEAYKSLNGKDNALGNAGIPAPVKVVPHTPSITNVTNNNNLPDHPESLRREAIKIAINPRSYCALMGLTTEKLLALDSRTLADIVHADQVFIEETAGFWNLAELERATTISRVKREYNAELCYSLGLTGPTNATPTAAFVDGRGVLLRAVREGFDVFGQYTGIFGDRRALAAFGSAAIAINLALNTSGTLTGRGTDSISERTMPFSPDGHKN